MLSNQCLKLTRNWPLNSEYSRKETQLVNQMTQDPPRASEYSDNEADRLPSISLLGVRVHRVDMDTTLRLIKQWVQGSEPHMIVTADASSIVIAHDDPEYREIVNTADLVTPDGAGILLGSKWLGTPLASRVSGVDVAKHICAMAAEGGWSVYFLGAAPGVAEAAAENLKKDYPNLKIAGIHDGYFSTSQDAEIAALVKASGAKAILVAMGIPRQEKLIHQYMNDMGVCVAIGVGGSFDVFSGNVNRAPVWMQRHGLEWLYRLAQNPKKISKVAALPKFMAMVWKEKLIGGGKD